MKRFLILLFLITIFTQTNLAAQSSKKSCVRSIKFIDLTDTANVLFWGSYREIPRLVMTAVKNGSIKAILIDYNKNAAAMFLSLSEYEKQIQISIQANIPFEDIEQMDMDGEEFYSETVDYLFARDLPYMGLDQTVSIVDGKEYVHVHYVNFYSYGSFSEEGKIRKYRFSVTWEDFVTILKQQSDLLYTPNIYGSWWRGNVFITNGRYLLETTTSDFIEQSRLYGIIPKDFTNLNEEQTVDSSGRKNYDPSLMDLYIIEEEQQSTWEINRLAFGTVPQDGSYLNERRFVFEWKDFLKVLQDEKRDASKNIYTLADAFLLQKFKYADTIPFIEISKNGKFKKGGKDGLCVSSLNTSFYENISGIANAKFHTGFLESIYLGDTSNVLLNVPGHNIAEIIHAHLLDGTLVSYQDDSVKRSMTPEKFKSKASQYLDVPVVDYGVIYEKGDTIQIYISNDNDWYGETRYFIVQQQFEGADYFIAAEQLNGPDFLNDSNLVFKLKRYYPPLVPVAELSVVEFMQDMTFDQEGKNKKYKLEALALHVSADGPSNIRGIQYPICYVRWEDLKTVLLNDPRASFIYQGQQIRLIDVIENRAYLSTFLKTGFVEIGE